MLTHTFCHLSGVGPSTEKKLWSRGILTWEQLAAKNGEALRGAKAALAGERLAQSGAALASLDAAFFARHLPPAELWRLWTVFRDDAAYVDIETTGLGESAEITTIALYDGRSVRTYVQGRNLADFEADVAPYRLLVTYNGKCFDAPVIERHFGMRLPAAHLDLRYALAGLGLKGGLKGCEKRLGLSRDELDGVDGFFAVLLWKEWEDTGDERVLETLLAYNVSDVLSLEVLAAHVAATHLAESPFAHLAQPVPAVRENPVRAHPEVIARVRGRFGV